MNLSTSSSDWRFLAWWTGTLAVLLVLMASATEWLLRAHVAPEDNFRAHVRLLASSTAPSAAFGDSHVARAFSPPEGTVNLAFPSENITQIADKALAYYKDREPHRVILQADPHMFAPYRLIARGRDPRARYERETSGLMLAVPERRRALPAYWSAFITGGGALTSKVERTDRGALLSPGNLDALLPRARAIELAGRAAFHQPYVGPATVAARATYARLLDSLTAMGADICMVSFPVSPAYLAKMADPGAPSIAFFREQAARVGARYLDHRAAIGDLAMFRDVDHLNKAGALAYSPRLWAACFGGQPQTTD